MSRFYHLVIFAFSLALLALGPAHARAAAIWPDGIGASGIVSGVYPGDDAGSCCWTGREARLRLQVPAGADTLVIQIFIPPYAVRGQSQGVTAGVQGEALQRRCCFGPGMHELAFRLGAPAKTPRAIAVSLRLRTTFTPAGARAGGDSRALGVLLRSASFLNAQTGLRYGTVSAGGANPELRLALIFLAAFAIGVAAYRRPIAGIVALIATDPFLLSVDLHGTTVTLPKAALLAVGAALIARGRFRSLRLGTGLAVLGIAQITLAVSMLLSSTHAGSHAAALRESLKALEYLLTFVVAYAAYRAEPAEADFRLTVAAITLVVAPLALLQEFVQAPQAAFVAGHALSRVAGPLEGPNQLAAFLGIAVPVMLALALWRAPLLLERIAIAAGVLTCILTLSRGGIAALAFGCVVIIALRYRPQWSRGIAITVCTLFAGVLALAFGEFSGKLHGGITKIFGGSGDAYNGGLGSRADLWHAAYAMWHAHPILGVGPGNFELLVGAFDPGVHTHANSIYFQTLAEQGIVGVVALALVTVASVALFARSLRNPIALGACGAALILAFHQIVDCLWLYPKVGVLWWVVLAVGAACVDAARAASSAETAADLTAASSSCSIA